MKKIIRCVSAALSLLCAALLGIMLYGNLTLPDHFSTVSGEIDVGALFSAESPRESVSTFSAGGNGDTRLDYTVKLMHVLPVKTVSVKVAERRYLAVGGELVGVRLKTEGVLVVSTEKFTDVTGAEADPAGEAGVKKGDIVLSVNGQKITENEVLTKALEESGGTPVLLTIRRNGTQTTLALTPRKTAATGLYKGGLWVRDSTVGVGTLTFSDPATGSVAALGHGIYDADTKALMPLMAGEICTATVSSVKKGAVGTPGEITGVLGSSVLGSITENCEEGIFGDLYYMEGTPEYYPMATVSEVHTGPAEVICTVSGSEKQRYDIEITKVADRADSAKNMTIRVTDQTLLAQTGGIIQGMSGSPILQDGMLVGAVTHVFVNDPKSGYGIFAENMMDCMD